MRGPVDRELLKGDILLGTSSVVQWLKLLTVNAGDLGSIPDQGIRSPKPQLKVCMLQLRPSAAKIIFKIK